LFQFVSNPQGAVVDGFVRPAPGRILNVRRATCRPAGAKPLVTASYALALRPAGTAPALFWNEAQPLSRLRNAVRVE
jgi:hypothetical protein